MKDISHNAKLYTIDEIRRSIAPVAEQYGVARVYLFGSYARGEAKEKSDIDLCIEEGKIRSLLQLSGFCVDLEKNLGKSIDVVSNEAIDGYFKENVEKEGMLIYG